MTVIWPELQTTANRLGRWLRARRARGHPLLANRRPGVPYVFSREDADLLAAEYRASAALGHVSDSAIQRRAEAEQLGVLPAARTITLAAGAPVQVDAASPDGKVLAEIFPRQGETEGRPAGEGRHRHAQAHHDPVRAPRHAPGHRLCRRGGVEDATGGGWVAQALRTWNVDVVHGQAQADRPGDHAARPTCRRHATRHDRRAPTGRGLRVRAGQQLLATRRRIAAPDAAQGRCGHRRGRRDLRSGLATRGYVMSSRRPITGSRHLRRAGQAASGVEVVLLQQCFGPARRRRGICDVGRSRAQNSAVRHL